MKIRLKYPERINTLETQLEQDSQRWNGLSGIEKVGVIVRTLYNTGRVFATLPNTIVYVFASAYQPNDQTQIDLLKKD